MKTGMSGVIWGQGVIKEETRPLHPNLGTMGIDYVTDFQGNVHAVPRGGGPSWLVETAPVQPIEDTVTITDTESGGYGGPAWIMDSLAQDMIDRTQR